MGDDTKHVSDVDKARIFLSSTPQYWRDTLIRNQTSHAGIAALVCYIAPTLTGVQVERLIQEAVETWRKVGEG